MALDDFYQEVLTKHDYIEVGFQQLVMEKLIKIIIKLSEYYL